MGGDYSASRNEGKWVVFHRSRQKQRHKRHIGQLPAWPIAEGVEAK
jgi:hypothetical protein